MYFIKTPFWLKKIYSSYYWDINTQEKILYLTFDDGPHPTATPFVLYQLQQYNAKATFFCIGKNVIAHPNIYAQIIADGHLTGNHTHNHLNGWKTETKVYLENIKLAEQQIRSSLFRPPYGRIKREQGKLLISKDFDGRGYNIIMWDVLSGDFDNKISPEKCLANVTRKATNGSIIVFHDSEKAFKNMSYALPNVLEFFSEKGYAFKAIHL